MQQYAVMFADVVGSTQLYETLGDANASAAIFELFKRITSIVEQHKGTVVKTIGDEVMCYFDTPSNSVTASCKIQEVVSHSFFAGQSIKLSIGMHYGTAILQSGDLFGDAVNTAARMTSMARSQQIVATQSISITAWGTNQSEPIRVRKNSIFIAP